ncbi:MAG: VanZ family protein [Planctomycetaceae bacterium]|nr:VanZ family protein [Planctomycetaceae bacterium]
MTSHIPAFLRRLHAPICLTLVGLVSWALLCPDPFLAVQRTPFSSLRTVSDILLHLTAYGTLSVICCVPLALTGNLRWRNQVLVLLVAHSMISELLQAFIPRRTCDPLDALANLTGIAVGALVAAWVTQWTAAPISVRTTDSNIANG